MSQIENEINCLEKKEIYGNSLKEITKYKKVMTKNEQNIKMKKYLKVKGIMFLLKKLTKLL